MINKYYILLILIFISISKISSKNLRKLAETSTTIAQDTELKNTDGKLTFAITLDPSTGLESGSTYTLKILVAKEGEKDASCNYDGTKLSCEYNYEKPYYGQIIIPKNTISKEGENLLTISNQLTLQQTVELTYDKAYVKFISGTATSNYELQVYVKETDIEADAFYQVDVKWNVQDKVANCTYSSENYLSCKYEGNYKNLIKLVNTKTNGSIKWKNTDIDFEKTTLLIFEVTQIYGYNINFESNQWKFYTHSKKINVEVEGYYFTMNVLINKPDASSDEKAVALCKTIDYHSECTINSNLQDSELSKEPNYLIYLSNDQDGASIRVTDDSLSNKKIISRAKTLTFVKAYELKYDEDNYWKFKIEIAEEGLRNGLNVTVDLVSGNFYYTASCIHNNKILSCTRDFISGSDLLLYLYFPKKYGTVTWSNSGSLDQNLKMALEITLTHKASYYLKYEGTKWTFKIDVESSKIIPANSLTRVDISYGSNGKAVADCGGNNATSTSNNKATLTCECTLSITEIPVLSSTKQTGSVTWNELSNPVIEKKLELKFIRSYNLEYVSSTGKFFFELEFENTEDLNLMSKKEYSLDMGFAQSKTSTSYFYSLAKCSLKTDYDNIFSCSTTRSYTQEESTKYKFCVKPTFNVNSDTIVWKEGVSDDIEIGSKPKLTFVKGTYKYESSKWILNLDVTGMSADIITGSKLYVDIAGMNEKTLECTVSSNVLLKCDTKISEASAGALEAYTLKKTTIGSSGLIWENTETNDDFYLFYLEATLVYKSNGEMAFDNNKWHFNLITSAFPSETKIIIDIIYGDEASTATCITKNSITSCIVDKDSQSETTPSIIISKDKTSSSTITWDGLTENKAISTESIDYTKSLTFNKVYDLTLDGNSWKFKILLTESNLDDYESIQIDIKFNDIKHKADCKYTLSTKILECGKSKSSGKDNILLINNEANKALIWSNLNSEIQLYVTLNIQFINYYGGFYQNKWKFNLKYENNEENSNDLIGYNALLDIKVNNSPNKALCEISEKFLLCESQHNSQTKDDVLTIQGGAASLGTITFSNSIPDNQKALKPIDITLENHEISSYSYSTNLIKFKIKGDLKENQEIEENTITEVQIIVKKNTGNKELTASCLTNAINYSPAILSCEATETVNENEDDIDIKVDSTGKSKYVTFYSAKENIEVFRHKEESKTTQETAKPEETTTPTTQPQKNNGLIVKINYLLLLSLIILL